MNERYMHDQVVYRDRRGGGLGFIFYGSRWRANARKMALTITFVCISQIFYFYHFKMISAVPDLCAVSREFNDHKHGRYHSCF